MVPRFVAQRPWRPLFLPKRFLQSHFVRAQGSSQAGAQWGWQWFWILSFAWKSCCFRLCMRCLLTMVFPKLFLGPNNDFHHKLFSAFNAATWEPEDYSHSVSVWAMSLEYRKILCNPQHGILKILSFLLTWTCQKVLTFCLLSSFYHQIKSLNECRSVFIVSLFLLALYANKRILGNGFAL